MTLKKFYLIRARYLPQIRAAIVFSLLYLLHKIALCTANSLPDYRNLHQRERPVIAVLADTRMTELSDFVIPYGVLKQAQIAEVTAVSPAKGIIKFFPALQARTELDFAEFELNYPAGADYVIVPALHYADDSAITQWLRQQVQRGATVMAICDGAWVLAHAGLLQHKRATSFWYAQSQLKRQFPETDWQSNQRYLADQHVITTSGVSAALPASLALVAAIAGRETARRLAQHYGVDDWSADHNSAEFQFTWRDYWQIASNYLSFWRHQQRLLNLYPGIDEVALALQADAYSRTYQSSVLSYHATATEISSLNGLRFVPDRQALTATSQFLAPLANFSAIRVLQQTLAQIAAEQGEHNCHLVRLLLEYPGACNAAWPQSGR